MSKAVILASAMFLGGVVHASAYTLDFSPYESMNRPADGMPLVIAAPGGETVTISYAGTSAATNGPSQFQSFNFNGTEFLSPGLGRPDPVTISFSKAVSALSFMAGVGQGGSFNASVDFFNGGTLLGTTGGSFSTPPYEGIPISFMGAITSAVITTTGSTTFGVPYNSLLSDVSYTVAAVPLPGTAPMLGTALLAVGLVGFAAKRKRPTAA